MTNSVVVAGLRRLLRHGLRRLRRVAHAAVRRQPVRRSAHSRRAPPAGRRPSRPAPAPRRTADAAVRGRRSRPRCGAPRRSDARGREANTARSWSSAPLFWLQSRNTLPSRRLLVIVAVTSLGIVFSSCCATRLASTDAPRELTGSSSGTYEMQPLAAAGERIRGQPDVSDQLAHLMGDLAQLASSSTPSPGSRSNTDPGSRARAVLPPRSPAHEPPLRHVHLQRGLLRDPRQSLDACR